VTAVGERNAIVSGVGMSQVGRKIDRGPMDLTLESALRAIEDAGLTRDDIDGLVTYPGAGYPLAQAGPALFDVQENLQLSLGFFRSSSEGPGPIQAVHNAALAVASGVARHVLVYRTSTRSVIGKGKLDPHIYYFGNHYWADPYGGSSPSREAVMATRHFHDYGTTREQVGAIPINQRRNAALNPDAVFRQPLTMEEYLNARMISSPLCLYDCDTWGDGSVSFVVSHRDYAPDCPKTPIGIEAFGTAVRTRASHDQREDLSTMSAAWESSAHMWSRTDLKPADVDTAHLYDGFSFLTLIWLEALGFCGKGEGGPFVERGSRIALEGELPTNTDGGQLSFCRLEGLGHLREACLQLRGEAGERQVSKRGGTPEVAVVSNGAGVIGGCMLVTAGVNGSA
jgi:acetyl-CoA acetyltransferase